MALLQLLLSFLLFGVLMVVSLILTENILTRRRAGYIFFTLLALLAVLTVLSFYGIIPERLPAFWIPIAAGLCSIGSVTGQIFAGMITTKR